MNEHEFKDLFKRFDPPAHGWARFQSKLERPQRQTWWAWMLLPATACAMAFILATNAPTAPSLFMQKAMASDLLFQDAPINTRELEIEIHGQKTIAHKISESKTVVIYKVED